MRKIASLIAVAAVLGSGAYVFVYIYRWEWNRALMMGIFLIATEIPVATALILRKVGKTATVQATAPDPGVLARIQEAAPRRHHFAWLDPRSGRTNVFITMFVGGGILVSGLAWAIDRFASRTGGRRLEGDLATRLGAIAFPAEGLVADDTELLAEEAPFHDDPELRLLLGTNGRP
ncbi:MAG TPA: hypothetical protein VGV93_09295 [Acidimicrobiales bacterium]|nr:hypothetical protein [Acidimicrobiales bacterium]